MSSISSHLLDDVAPTEYAKFITAALDNPDMIWRKPFESLSLPKQNLLVALYFMSQYGANLEKLKAIYLSLNSSVCKHYLHPVEPMAFEKGLRDLESGFISIAGKSVRFVNPAVRDFLKAYLADFSFLAILASGARYAEWARDLWRHGCGLVRDESNARGEWAEAFVEFSARIEKEPVWRHISSDALTSNDICQTERQLLLMDWWDASGNIVFLERAISLVLDQSLTLDADEDAEEIPELVWRIRNVSESECPSLQEAIDCLSIKLGLLLEDSISTDKLVRVLGRVDEFYSRDTPEFVIDSIAHAVAWKIGGVDEFLRHTSSSVDVTEHIEQLEELGKSTQTDVSDALSKCRERLEELQAAEDEAESSPGLPFGNSTSGDVDISDAEIDSLFGMLVR